MLYRYRMIDRLAVLVVMAIVAAMLAITAHQASAETLTCATEAVKDTWVDKKTRTATHGSETVLRALIKSTALRYPHVAFDVSCIPAGATITGARVEFTPRITVNQTNVRVWKSASATWSEATMNWNTQPLTVAGTETPGRIQHTAGVPETYELPAAGRPSGNGLIAYQMREVQWGPNPEIEFHSREAASGRPRLVVDYEGTAPTTTTVAPTTTTTPPQNCLLTSNFSSPQAAVNATPSGGCLIVDGYYTLTSTLSVTRPMTIQCLDPANGFTAGNLTMVSIANTSDVTYTGCRMESTGPTLEAGGAVGLGGTVTRITLSRLTVRNAEFGVAGSPTASFVKLLDSDIRFLYATGFGLYSGQTRDIEVGGNTFVAHQRAGTAGKAAIQTGGIAADSTEDRHSRWNIHHNTVDSSPAAVGTATGCPPGDLVGIGLDQLSSSTVDDNVVRHCLGPGEGIVVNGPDNAVRRNRVYDVGNGAYTFISYPSPTQSPSRLVFEDNLADGRGGSGNQGLALSFAPNGPPVTGVRVRRFTSVEHSWGAQAYSFGGTVAGSDNRLEDSDLDGNVFGGCNGLNNMGFTVVNTAGCG
jgi:hypothetical protein